MIRIHFPAVRENSPVIQLAQACGVGAVERVQGVDVHRYDRLMAEGPKLWKAAGLDESQVVIYPHHYWGEAEAQAVMEEARRRQLPLILFRSADDATPVSLPYGVIYRESILGDQVTASERALAAFSDDLLAERGGQVGAQRERPSVGFCGYVGTTFNRLLYQLTGRKAKAHGLILRHRALGALRRSERVECNFIERAQFWGGGLGRFHQDVSRQVRVRQEYLDNIFNTDYTLCMRGAGNFSYRFYEVLAAGRIPLFINTRCVLPFASQIDWQKHCVWVDESNLKKAGEVLAAFHARLSGDDFKHMQLANRKLWEDWLEPLSFYRRVLEAAIAAS